MRIGAADYQAYIASEAWRYGKARQQCLRRAAGRCRACRRPRRLEAHHWTYDRLGFERPGDLVALCDRCHVLVHRLALVLSGSRTRALGPATLLTIAWRRLFAPAG